MAIIYLNQFDIEPFTRLDNFSEYNYTESVDQHGFIFIKNDRKLYVYLNCESGIHTARLEIDGHKVSVLNYYKPDCLMVYDQSIYFEHERTGHTQKIIEIDTEAIEINVDLLDNLSLATKDWQDASPQTLEKGGFRLLKDGIRCTSEADRGKNIFYRCLFCETMISSVPKDSVGCKCGRMSIDLGMFRFHVHNLTKIQVLEKKLQVGCIA